MKPLLDRPSLQRCFSSLKFTDICLSTVFLSLSCSVTQCQPSHSYRNGLTFENILEHRRVYALLVLLQNQPKSSPLHHCASQLVWGVCCDMLFGFHPVWCCALWPNISTLVSLFPTSCSFFRWKLVNLSCVVMFFLERKLSLGFPPKHTCSVFFWLYQHERNILHANWDL